MKKPNKLYRKLGGRRSTAGAAFAIACHPVLSLRKAFGRDVHALDASENFALAACKHGFQMVMATLKSWGKTYRGSKISRMFSMLAMSSSKKTVITPKLEMD